MGEEGRVGRSTVLVYPPVDLSDAFEVTTVFGPSGGLRLSDLHNCYMISLVFHNYLPILPIAICR